MKTITFDQFSIGVDVRKLASTSDANRLRELTNGYVTPAKTVRKRPGVMLNVDFAALGETGTKGLSSGNGVLNTFVDSLTPIAHSDPEYNNVVLIQGGGTTQGSGVKKVHYSETYNGYLYSAVEFNDGEIQHHWSIEGPFTDDFSDEFMTVDTTPTQVVDGNCPNTKGIIKQDDRLFAVNDDVVNYNDPTVAVGNAMDWTEDVSGAGFFLPTGLRAEGSSEALALGQYQGSLAVFHIDSVQLWTLDIGNNADAYNKSVTGIGTRYPRSVREFAGDIIFLSESGFRSITTQSYTDNVFDVDIGSAIDRLVKSDLTPALEPISEHFPKHGQYWCMYTAGSITRVWVYTFSRTMKISAWSKYEFPFIVDDVTAHNGKVYMRSGEKVYVVDDTETVWSDNGSAINFLMVMPYLDFKMPGSTKYIASMDIVSKGTVGVQFKYDPYDESLITDPIYLTGDTRSRQTIPVEITTAGIAPVFTSNTAEDVQIDMIQFHYDELGII